VRTIADSIVRVETESGWGTGFIVSTSNGEPLIGTAFHVVARGGPIRVSRQVNINDFEHYVEAYTDAQVVAFDAESDLALLQIRNVPASKLPALELADPIPEEPITSYGFGDSALTKGRLGLTRKDGKLSSLIQLPVVDHLSGRIVKENAVKAILVSSALEPGFSGGPTVNAAGKVVGINVQKDDSHQAQNACVHASLLRSMIAQLKRPNAPSTSEVAAFLSTITADYLLLDPGDRLNIPEHTYVGLEELPRLRALSERVFEKPHESLVAFSQVPGQTLPTLTASATRDVVNDCRKRQKAISSIFKDLGVEQRSHCAIFVTRPLAADIIAATLHWDASKPTTFSVSKVEEVDPVGRLYTARIKSENDPSKSWLIHLVLEGSALKLRLFDKSLPYVFTPSTTSDSAEIAGRWSRTSIDGSHVELLDLSVAGDDSVSAQHTVRHTFEANTGEVWRCSQTRSIAYEVQQQFSGRLKGGVVLADAEPRRASRSGTACSETCNRCTYTPDVYATFKRVGDKLVMTRTDNANAEVIEFTRRGGAS
jgi:hypothetical protein